MTDVQEHTTFVSLIEELSMRLLDSTRIFDTSSVRCFVRQSPATLEEECQRFHLTSEESIACTQFGVYGTFVL